MQGRTSPLWLITFLLFGVISPSSIYANNVLIGRFAPYGSEQNSEIEKQIQVSLKRELSQKNFTVSFSNQNKEIIFQSSNANKNQFYLEGHYTKTKDSPLSIFIQIYNPNTGNIIDAASESLNLNSIAGVELDSGEINRSNQEIINAIAKQVSIELELNPEKKESRENIQDHLISKPIYKQGLFNITQVDTKEEAKKTFQLLEEESISIVSKKVGESESINKTAAIVSVYNRQKIVDTGARNLADILKQVPGVEVFYDQFGFYKVAFRGIRSHSGVLILLDSHRINNFYDGSAFLDIRADAIEKVEIIRGPGSSIHGTNAFVGVINVITRKTNNDKGGQVSLRGGIENTLEPSIVYGIKLGESWKINTYASRYESKRANVHIPHDNTCSQDSWKTQECNSTLLPLPLDPYTRTNDRKEQINGFINIENQNSFYINLKAIQEKRGPFVGEIAEVNPNSELGFQLFTGAIGFQKLAISPTLSLSSRIYGDLYNRKDDIQVERTNNKSHLGLSARKTNSYSYETQGVETILQWTPMSKFLIQFGVNFERLILKDFSISKNYLRSDTSNLLPIFFDFDNVKKNQNKDRHIRAGFTQIIYDPAKWFSFSFGIRYDEYSDFGKTLNPKGGLVITAFENTIYGTLAFKFLYGTAFRAPTFQELYDQTQIYQPGGVLGNKNLRPETIQTGEAGMDYNTPYKPLHFVVNGFYTTIKDNIGATNISGTFPSNDDAYKNLRGVKIGGLETEMRLTYSNRNYLFANISWLQALDNGGLVKGQDKDFITILLDVPQARGNIGFNVELFKYITLNNTVWISSLRKSNARFPFESQADRVFEIPQYHIWNMSLASTESFWEKGNVRFSVFNILDYKNYDDANYSLPAFLNRSIPSMFQYGRYMEIKLVYNLN